MLYKGSQTTPFSINRTSIQNSSNKYIEEVKWGTGNKMAIAIGLNPSACLPYSLDKTNELLCRAFHSSGYDGYYLMNLFSYVQTNKFKRKGLKEQTLEISKTIISYLTNNSIAKLDIVFFCGRSCYFTNDMITNLLSIQPYNTYYFFVGPSLNLHQHPGRGVSTTNIVLTPLGNSIKFNGHYIK